MNNISVGFTVGFGSITQSVYTAGGLYVQDQKLNVTLWEPTLDYVATFGPPSQETVGRFRIGGGASFFSASRLGIGLDLVLEGGGFNGQWVGGLQLIASPEFKF